MQCPATSATTSPTASTVPPSSSPPFWPSPGTAPTPGGHHRHRDVSVGHPRRQIRLPGHQDDGQLRHLRPLPAYCPGEDRRQTDPGPLLAVARGRIGGAKERKRKTFPGSCPMIPPAGDGMAVSLAPPSWQPDRFPATTQTWPMIPFPRTPAGHDQVLISKRWYLNQSMKLPLQQPLRCTAYSRKL